MHWPQAVTIGFFILGFFVNMLASYSEKPNVAKQGLVAMPIMLFYQWVLWYGGWYS